MAIAAAALAALTACGSSGGRSSVFSGGPANKAVLSSQPAAPASAAGGGSTDDSYKHVWKWDSTAPDGSTWTDSFHLGDVQSASAALDGADGPLFGACVIDTQRDAVVPFEVDMTSTTSGFRTAMHTQMAVVLSDLQGIGLSRVPLSAGQSVAAAVVYSDDGPTCNQPSEENGSDLIRVSKSDVSDGGMSSLRGLFVLAGYYSPANPSGDTTFLSKIWLALPATGVFTDSSWTNSGVTGPDVYDLPNFYTSQDAWYFPMAGSGTLDCSKLIQVAATACRKGPAGG